MRNPAETSRTLSQFFKISKSSRQFCRNTKWKYLHRKKGQRYSRPQPGCHLPFLQCVSVFDRKSFRQWEIIAGSCRNRGREWGRWGGIVTVYIHKQRDWIKRAASLTHEVLRVVFMRDKICGFLYILVAVNNDEKDNFRTGILFTETEKCETKLTQCTTD
jgi:hypothetical protein